MPKKLPHPVTNYLHRLSLKESRRIEQLTYQKQKVEQELLQEGNLGEVDTPRPAHAKHKSKNNNNDQIPPEILKEKLGEDWLSERRRVFITIISHWVAAVVIIIVAILLMVLLIKLTSTAPIEVPEAPKNFNPVDLIS